MPGVSPRDGVAIELGAQLLREGRAIDLVVGGQSMWPLVRSGDRLHLQPGARLEVGSLAAFVRGERLVVHRVVDVSSSGLLLRGDNGGGDDRLTRAEVLGVVTRQLTIGRMSIDHTGRVVRRANRLVAEISRRTRGPWNVLRAARLSWARLRGC